MLKRNYLKVKQHNLLFDYYCILYRYTVTNTIVLPKFILNTIQILYRESNNGTLEEIIWYYACVLSIRQGKTFHKKKTDQ